MTLHCTDSCAICYHASCWRRYKSEGVTGADKDYLQSDCPTPDCPGTIDTVHVYDNRGKLKTKVSGEREEGRKEGGGGGEYGEGGGRRGDGGGREEGGREQERGRKKGKKKRESK